jgi:hypothetical protein
MAGNKPLTEAEQQEYEALLARAAEVRYPDFIYLLHGISFFDLIREAPFTRRKPRKPAS